jgi:hypothetical protein
MARAVAAVWGAAAGIALFAPDLVSGSEHEHLPIAAFTVWIWAALATGFLVMIPAGRRRSSHLASTVALAWLAVAIATIFGPVMVTGSDPTRIPIVALTAPIFGAFATAFVALDVLRRT